MLTTISYKPTPTGEMRIPACSLEDISKSARELVKSTTLNKALKLSSHTKVQ
jgi:hypothetical protein